MKQELVVAYDAREMWLSVEQYGDPQLLKRVLLRDDVVKPLSIDKVVWKSIFHSNIHINGEMAGTVLDIPSMEVPVEDRAFWYYSWASLPALQTYLSGTYVQAGFPTCWLIAVSILDDVPENAQHIEPAEVNIDWKCLGYDVAEDTGMWSKLCGFIHSADEMSSLRRQFAASINQYHLFTAHEAADEYRQWADQRDRGHAPNYVYGLYLIEQYPRDR